MKIENVSIGETYTTTTKLYKALELSTKVKGNQKIAQDAEIARWIDYEPTGRVSRGKVTNEIVITDIRQIPLERVDNRSNNGGISKYAEHIDKLLLQALHKDNHIIDTVTNIFTSRIPILSNHWIDLRQKGAIIVASKYKVAQYSVTQYQQQVNSTITNMFLSSLNRLQRLNKIEWYKEYMLLSNKYGAIPCSQYDNDILNKILEIESEILENHQVTRKQLRYDVIARNDFYSDCQLTLNCYTDGDVWSYYNVYNIQLLDNEQIEFDAGAELEKLTDKLLLSIHNSLGNKMIDNEGSIYYPWLTDKLIKFVTKYEYNIFTYATGGLIDNDIVAYSLAKVNIAFKGDKYQKQLDSVLPY